MASTRLTRTNVGTVTNNKKFTISFWMKRSLISVAQETVFGSYPSGSSNDYVYFPSGDQLGFFGSISGSQSVYLLTTRVFRDPSAWYHIVIAVDTTQGTAADRVKIYVNGTQETAFDQSSYPAQDVEFRLAKASNTQEIGAINNGNHFDGMLTHFHFVDGTQYDASTFGSTDATSGIWKPNTAPSVTYGLNGFFLKFENSGSMGTDSAGSNDFTVSGNLTQNVDSPTNNQAVLNPLYSIEYNSALFFTNGNNTVNINTTAWNTIPCTMAITKGRWYFEGYGHTNSSNYVHYGITSQAKMNANATQPESEINTNSNGYAYGYYGTNGKIYYSTPSTDTSATYGDSYGSTDYIGIFVDLEDNKIYFAKNGTLQNSGTGYDIHADGKPYLLTTAVYDGLTNLNFGSGVFGTTALTGTTYSDANSYGTFKYSPNQGGASNFDSTAKNFYTMNTKNLKQFGS
tara:strand:+ start:1342 stop:2712 length:1371 start_codon:yes stop_codon:yes gene_type:complete